MLRKAPSKIYGRARGAVRISGDPPALTVKLYAELQAFGDTVGLFLERRGGVRRQTLQRVHRKLFLAARR